MEISKDALEKMFSHLKSCYPSEGCGFMIADPDSSEFTIEVLPVENQNKTRAHDRFEISAQDYMKVEKYAEKSKKIVAGIYHSHPDHPAEPSKTDLASAFPGYNYVIVSIEKGEVVNYTNWVIEDFGDEFSKRYISIKGS